jgi:hypothetical protein
MWFGAFEVGWRLLAGELLFLFFHRLRQLNFGRAGHMSSADWGRIYAIPVRGTLLVRPLPP